MAGCCLLFVHFISLTAELTSCYHHLRPDLVFLLALNRLLCVNEYMWFQISTHPPPPLRWWTCVSWCRWSSIPADYSMGYVSEGTAVVGIREAAGLQPPAPLHTPSHPRVTLVSFTCQGLKPAIVPGVNHLGAPSSAGAQCHCSVADLCNGHLLSERERTYQFDLHFKLRSITGPALVFCILTVAICVEC